MIGPPISTDLTLQDVDDVHRLLIDDFVDDSIAKAEDIKNSKRLRQPIFSEQDFRNMIIYWSTTMEIRLLRASRRLILEAEYLSHWIGLRVQ